MHETVYASSLLRIVLEEIARHQTPEQPLKVTGIILRLGLLNCIEAHTLSGCFALLAEGTAAEGATMEIVHSPLLGYCTHCKKDVETSTRAFQCPECGNHSADWRGGNEITIDAIRVAPADTVTGEPNHEPRQ